MITGARPLPEDITGIARRADRHATTAVSGSANRDLQRQRLPREGVGRLHRGVELLGVGALLARAVARALPAAERHVVVDARRRQVDHHHAGLAVALEVRRVFQARRADAGRQAELGVVGDRQRLVVVLDADDVGDRPEDLLARDAHLVGRLGEQRRLQVEAGRLAVEQLAAPGELGALVLGDLDVLQVLVELALVDDRADMRAGLERVVDDEALQALGQRLDEAVVDAGLHDQARGRGAALAGGEEGAVDGAFDRDLQVGVVEHDERVLAAHLELHLLHRLGRDAGLRPPCGRSRPSR